MGNIVRPVVVALGSAVLAAHASAQAPEQRAPVEYHLAFPNAANHEGSITATFRAVPPGPLEVRMARSSPGRYAIHEFAKNVYSVSAKDGRGQPLPIRRTDPYSWTVEGHDGTVQFSYTLFADRGDGTYSQINLGHAHLNIPATLAYAPALASRPAQVRITPVRPGWGVATQLIPGGDGSWRARDLQYLMDSPIEVAPLRERRWASVEPGKTYAIRLMVHSEDSDADLDRYAAMAERVYRAHVAMWGDVPDYDGGTYTFLADYERYATGDGMEHRNSTYIPSSQSLAEGNFGQIQTLSHELFHSWNVERLRPAELEPFAFDRANPAPTLWFAEGFTNYYGPLLVRRAAVSSVDDFLRSLGSTLTYVLSWSGRRYGSPIEMSLRAPFVDAATSIDPANEAIFTSYYPYGAAIALALDLSLRGRGSGRTLDDMMRLLWRSHGMNEKPFVVEDLRGALAQVSDAGFADAFFQRSVHASELPDFGPLLAQAGLTLKAKRPDKPYLGAVGVEAKGATLTVTGYPEPGSAFHGAGIGNGDQILTAAGKPVRSAKDWENAIAAMRAGKSVTLSIRSLGQTRAVEVTPAADPALEVLRDEAIGKTPTPAQLAFRQSWLGTEGTMMPKKPEPKR